MTPNIRIIGAGLAGLLAANLLRRYQPTVVELQSQLPSNHHALLRFRTTAVSNSTAIPFSRVLVRKGIWDGQQVVSTPTIPLANRYSLRVTEAYMDRSIWNLEPEHRYVAPPNLPELMAQDVKISFDTPFSFIDHGRGSDSTIAISTLPMPALMEALRYPWPAGIVFTSRAIRTIRVPVANTNVNQTIYNAAPAEEEGCPFDWYRATVQGGELILETMGDYAISAEDVRKLVSIVLRLSFGMSGQVAIGDAEVHVQKYGKINPIPEHERKAFIGWATTNYHIYSLGRFATWRPLLLDDIVGDCQVIDRLISSNSCQYTRQLAEIKP